MCLQLLWHWVARLLSSSNPTSGLIKSQVLAMIPSDLASHLSDLIASIDTFVPAVPSASKTLHKAAIFTSFSFLSLRLYRKVFANNSTQKFFLPPVPHVLSLLMCFVFIYTCILSYILLY